MFIRTLTYGFLVMMLLASQSLPAGGGNSPASDEIIIYPPPPDSARIQFLTAISTSTDITGKRSGIMKYILGEEESRPIFKPYGIASTAGKLFVCDTQMGALEIIDLQKRKFDYFDPAGRGQLFKPVNCAVDDQGFLYVADTDRKQIVIFDADLNYAGSLGNPDNAKPTDVKVTDENIWVCDLTARKINVYSQISHTFLKSFPDASPGDDAYLFSPVNIDIGGNHIYVTDFGDFKIKVFTLNGEFKKSVGGYGQTPGLFLRPKGIAVDKNENLYVVDAGFENVQIFDRQGQLLMFFGGSYKGPGDMWLPAKVAIDYQNLDYFQKYVDSDFVLKYLIYVTNQFGPDKISVYGFIDYR